MLTPNLLFSVNSLSLPLYAAIALIVVQEPVLFAESIFYNIAFGLRRGEEDATLAEVSLKLSSALLLESSLEPVLLLLVGINRLFLSLYQSLNLHELSLCNAG